MVDQLKSIYQNNVKRLFDKIHSEFNYKLWKNISNCISFITKAIKI